MTVKFCFGNARKDGTKNLKIRLKSKGRDKKISIPGVYINPKNWDTPNNRVKSKCENAKAYNEIVIDYQKKILKVKGQLELQQIDFDIYRPTILTYLNQQNKEIYQSKYILYLEHFLL